MNLNDLCKRCGEQHSTMRCSNAALRYRRGDRVQHRGNGRLGTVARKLSNTTDYMVRWDGPTLPLYTTMYPGWMLRVSEEGR